MSEFITATGSSIGNAADILNRGGLVAIPTETVYGLAANAFNEEAILKIFQVKNRPSFDPLIVHIADKEKLGNYVNHIPKAAQKLADHFWPGPLTLLLTKNKNIPDIVTSGLDTVAIRNPSHPLLLQLLASLDFPLAAPSANPFGYVSPTTAKHVADQLGGKIPYILDGGPSTIGIESTIVGFENENCIIYRLGGIDVEAIEKIAGPVEIRINNSSNPLAPGLLESHYAPLKPLYLGDIDLLLNKFNLNDSAILTLTDKKEKYSQARETIVLSSEGNLNEAASNLFSALRKMDMLNVAQILAETVPDIGIGKAINDRLRRASKKRM